MLNWLFGVMSVFGVVYIGIAIAAWYEDTYITCWYCRILNALAWPYGAYQEWRG